MVVSNGQKTHDTDTVVDSTAAVATPETVAPGINGKHRNNGHSDHTGPRTVSANTGPLARVRNFLNPAVTHYAHVTGWGMKVPDHVLTNADLEAVVETTDEWIRTRTGIEQRRIASERDSLSMMGFEAARAALDRANVLPSDLDLIIVATSTSEDVYPSTASRIQNTLGATRAGAFDLSAACSGFVYAVNMAAQAIRSGSISKALVIGAEINSRVLDWSDRSTCILFGDGSGAVVLEGSDQPGGLLSCVLGSDGSGADLLGIPTSVRSTLPENARVNKIHMDGREVFRFAVHVVVESVRDAVEQASLTLEDISLIVPHQANQRIISAAARSLGLPESKFFVNVQRYGNTSAASIPIALCEAEREGRLAPNDNIIVVGFGGGLTWAAGVIKWRTMDRQPPRGIAFRLGQARREAQYVAAFWRDRITRLWRRLEAIVRGSPVKVKPERPRRRDRAK